MSISTASTKPHVRHVDMILMLYTYAHTNTTCHSVPSSACMSMLSCSLVLTHRCHWCDVHRCHTKDSVIWCPSMQTQQNGKRRRTGCMHGCGHGHGHGHGHVTHAACASAQHADSRNVMHITHVCITCKHAFTHRRYLLDFATAHPTRVSILYYLSGIRPDDDTHHIELVPQHMLDATRASYTRILSLHIYSLAPITSSDVTHTTEQLWSHDMMAYRQDYADADVMRANPLRDNRYGHVEHWGVTRQAKASSGRQAASPVKVVPVRKSCTACCVRRYNVADVQSRIMLHAFMLVRCSYAMPTCAHVLLMLIFLPICSICSHVHIRRALRTEQPTQKSLQQLLNHLPSAHRWTPYD